MDPQLRGVLLGMGVLFLLAFTALTLVALSSAELNLGAIIAFGSAFAVIVLALIGLIGAIRSPPDEDE